jgi:hypothetical protein
MEHLVIRPPFPVVGSAEAMKSIAAAQ